MDLFGMGMGEIVLILVVALIIWGPEKIPEIARTLGRVARTLRKASFDLTTQISKELEVEDKSNPSQSTTNSGAETKESSNADIEESGGEKPASPRDQ